MSEYKYKAITRRGVLMIFHIQERHRKVILEELERAVNEYFKLSQMFSFEGTEKDFRDLDRFAASYMEYFIAILRGEAVQAWSWDSFKRNLELQQPTSDGDLDALIEHVIFHVGSHEDALHTGERWTLREMDDRVIKFTPVYSPSICLTHLQEIKEKFPFVGEVSFNSEGLQVHYRSSK
jgi:hypothetical protein